MSKKDTYFYCYSLQLKNFLKLQGFTYLVQTKHKNGNRIWLFKSTPQLNESLTKWNKYKYVFGLSEEKE